MAIVKRNQAVMWSNAANGKFGGYDVLGVGLYGSEDATLPGPGRESTYVQDENGNPILAVAYETPPGGLPNFTINFFEQYAQNALRVARAEGRKVAVQQRFHQYGVLTNPTGWTKFFHYGQGQVGEESRSGAQIEYTGEGVRSSMPATFETAFEYLRPQLTAQTPPAQVADALDVDFIGAVLKDIVAYPGPDQVGFVAMEAVSGATAKLLATRTGGSTWENADADPFGTDEDIIAVRSYITNPNTGGRVVAGNADAAEIAYADFVWSDPTALTWTTVATTGNVTALGWRNYKELLVATASGIFISENGGVAIARQLSSNANITGIAYAPQHPALEPYVYFFGASNTILRKKLGSDTIDTLVGPTTGAFNALAVALDGTIWAGHGTKLYRSNDGAASAAGWTEVYDFGTSMAVVGIGPVEDDPEVLQVVVDNATPGTGTAWVSPDGVAFEQITSASNDGYNAAYFSKVTQKAVIVGDDDTSAPVIHKLDA